MKIIDKTPFQNAEGESRLVQSLRGMPEYGGEWYAELNAQETVIAQLERGLGNEFTLIRNLRLADSQIVEPLILVGPPGVFVMYSTPVSGFFEAKGDQWNVIKNNRRVPGPVNMLQHVEQLAHALQVYLDHQAAPIPTALEGILITTNPAAHIEVRKPIVWVVTSSAVKHFVAMLAQSTPVLESAQMAEIVDHIVESERDAAEPESLEAGEYRESTTKKMPADEEFEEKDAEQAPARARAIFHAAEELKPPDLADLRFAFYENTDSDVPARLRETSPTRPRPSRRRRAGLTSGQWVVLAIMLLVEVGVLGALAYLVYFNAP